MLDGSHFFECACGSDEHTIRFILDYEDGDLYTSVYLNQYRSWWKTAWVGIRYIFGYKCRYGDWDCWMLDASDAVRLRDMCDEFIKKQEEIKNEQISQSKISQTDN